MFLSKGLTQVLPGHVDNLRILVIIVSANFLNENRINELE